MRKVNSLFKKSLKVPARASIYYVVAMGISKAIGFLSTLLFTRLLSTEEYGKFALYSSILAIATILLSAFFSGGVIFRALEDKGEEGESFILTAKVSYIFFSFIICLLLFTFSGYFGITLSLFPFVFIQCSLDGIIAIDLSKRRHSYSYRRVALVTVLSSGLPSVVSLILIEYATDSYFGRVLGFLISSVILALPALWSSRGARIRGEHILYVLSSGVAFFPSALSHAISTQTDKLLLTSALGVGAVAKYSVVHSVGAVAGFLLTASLSALTPWIQRKLRRGEYSAIAEIAGYGLTAFSLISVAVANLSPVILDALFPSEYSDARAALLPISLSVIPAFSESVFSTVLVSAGVGRKIFRVSLFSAAFSLGATVLLVRTLGYFGAGLALLLSALLTSLEYEGLLRREGMFLPIGRSRIFLSMLSSVAFSVGIYALAEYPYLIPLALIPLAIRALGAIFGVGRLITE